MRKTASSIADTVLHKCATSTDPISDSERRVMQYLTGPIHAAVRAPSGKKMDAYTTVTHPGMVGGLKGLGIGAGGGAGLGALGLALAALIKRDPSLLKEMAAPALMGGAALGGLGGSLVGTFRGQAKGYRDLQEQSQDWADAEE